LETSQDAFDGPAFDRASDLIFGGGDGHRKALARRSQLEVRMDVLRAVKEGAEKPTQIMYKANLSWAALQSHLVALIQHGLLEWANDGTRKKYDLTIKGANVMLAYVKILEEVGHNADLFYMGGHMEFGQGMIKPAAPAQSRGTFAVRKAAGIAP
jgi:predicted transcriptional regulator